MTTSRPSMTIKPLQGYKILPDGLVWYPISDESQYNYVFSNLFQQVISVGYTTESGHTYSISYKSPAYFFHALKLPRNLKQAEHDLVAKQDTIALAKQMAVECVNDAKELPPLKEETLYANMLTVIRERVKAEKFKKALLETEKGYLYRDSYTSSNNLWGGGKDGSGKNWLGRALMEVRNELFSAAGKNEFVLNLDEVMQQAKVERSSKTESGVALHTFATPLVVNSLSSTTSTILPSSASSTSSSTSTSSTSSTSSSSSAPTSSSIPSSPELSLAICNQIISALGVGWSFRAVAANASHPAAYTVFENDKERHFEIYKDKISTDDSNDETLAKMLDAFAILNPGKSASITVGNAELEGKWRALCNRKNIKAEIKVTAEPAAEEKAPARAVTEEKKQEEKEDKGVFTSTSSSSASSPRQPPLARLSSSPHGHERAIIEEVKETDEEYKEEKTTLPSPFSLTGSSSPGKLGKFGSTKTSATGPTSSPTKPPASASLSSSSTDASTTSDTVPRPR
jgi:predicted NAD-dependent protein-ADP-ribosyltransferase YbiA (DUF1768 family)